MAGLDLDKLRHNDSEITARQNKIKGTNRHIHYNKFIKGPIPLEWVKKSAKLLVKVMNIILILWYLKGLTKEDTIKMTGKLLDDFSVSRQAMYRCLENLENAGLISVKTHIGRCTEVKIIVNEEIENNLDDKFNKK